MVTKIGGTPFEHTPYRHAAYPTKEAASQQYIIKERYAMDIVTLDFETYYTSDYSLRKMSPAEYILSPLYECTGLAVKYGSQKPFWVEGDEVQQFFDSQSENVMSVSHNALFDNCIMAWRYGWVPRLMVDTLGLARSTLGAKLRSLSLDKVSEYFSLGKKGDDLANVKNMRLADIRNHPALYERHKIYGMNDADLCYGIFEKIVIEGGFPMAELAVMDAVLRCTVEPQFRVDPNVLMQSLNEIKTKKEATLAGAMLLGADGKSTLMSNGRFAELLKQHGVNPPRKISGTTGKETYAFAKSDQEFIDLLEHPNPNIQTLVAARMGHKSTIEESRHERFINIANLDWPVTKRNPGGNQRLMPMPLRYGGAHTHRLSGDWKLNVQNMGRGSSLRRSLVAPEGYVVVAGDESQVEARFVATLCGQEDLRHAFDIGEDVYCFFASDLFGRVITKVDKVERWLGKNCLAADTMVLTDAGWLPIINLTTEHKVWDGLEWVKHQGLLPQGVKEVETAYGLTMTKCHEILTEHGWQAWNAVHTNRSLFQSALSSATSPLSNGSTGATGGNHFACANVANTQSQQGQTCQTVSQPDAITVQSVQLQGNDTTATKVPCQTTSTESDYSTGCLQQSAGVTPKVTECSITMGEEGSGYSPVGEQTEHRSLNTCSPYPDGIDQNSTWTGSTTIRDTNPETSGLLLSQKICPTKETLQGYSKKSKNLRTVYDIANAGPRQRFTVLSSEGPVIVHNCILGLGFGLGYEKFGEGIPVLSFNQIGKEIPMPPDEAKRVVDAYRNRYPHIPASWKLLNTVGINALFTGSEWRWGPVVFQKEEILLPNGMKLYYHNLRQQDGGRFGKEWVFDYGGKTKRCYGGMLLENICQALARIITMEAAVRVRARLTKLKIQMALQVHDELVFVVKQEHEQVVRYVLEHELRQRPWWLPNIPLDCEIGSGPNYGEAK